MTVTCPFCHQIRKNNQSLSLYWCACTKAQSMTIAFLRKRKHIAEHQKEINRAFTSGASASNDAERVENVHYILISGCIVAHLSIPDSTLKWMSMTKHPRTLSLNRILPFLQRPLVINKDSQDTLKTTSHPSLFVSLICPSILINKYNLAQDQT